MYFCLFKFLDVVSNNTTRYYVKGNVNILDISQVIMKIDRYRPWKYVFLKIFEIIENGGVPLFLLIYLCINSFVFT